MAATKKSTRDHGEIIHFAGRHHLFPVAQKADPLQVRLASKADVAETEVRVGWKIYFRPFIDRNLAFLYDEEGAHQAVTEEEARAASAAPGQAS